ncbi:MAG: hypothetical protein ACLS70_08470 [[Clostridium] symbiosum]
MHPYFYATVGTGTTQGRRREWQEKSCRI